ncbi:hypothetical protein KIN20_022579 [Parelaphostrongylus tenuis]|uniref:Protein asunder n=1 Tax=Parelaphostrongylus tenuis TaxID=148309 RepID=A0AAD5N6A2_PARTN|nr:hypothetical protein KIN20_022579 [Parelaphostrongylus tenuis]
MKEDGDECCSSTLYRDKPEWADVEPIYPSKEEDGAVRIAVTEQFRDAFAYLRAVMASGEMSSRVFLLTEDCIQLNPANYTLWQFRRELLKKLEVDLTKELKFLDDVIIQTPKNYQVWHHRKSVAELIGPSSVAGELAFTELAIEYESKNYHAWQHRQWVLRHFVFDSDDEDKAVENELSFTYKLILEDPRNNSAWNHRYFVLESTTKIQDSSTLDNEINLAKRLIEKMPNNESVWNYLSGLLLNDTISFRPDVIAFAEDLYERTEPSRRAPYLVSFLCDILLNNIENDFEPTESFKRVKRMGIGPNHKVLVVLDHSPRFAKSSCNPLSITLKESSVNRVVGKCDKSLWTWCVEATMELHRIVSDLFPQESEPSCSRLIRLVLADYVGRVLQHQWGTELVTQQELLSALSAIGPPSTNDDDEGAAISGVTLAIEALSQLSDAQLKEDRKKTLNKNGANVKERDNFLRIPKCWDSPSTSSVSESGKKHQESCGSVVIFTSYTDKKRLTDLENEVAEMINNRNRIIKSLQDSSTFTCVNNVRLYIINILPTGQSCNIASKVFREVSTTMSSYILSRTAGPDLISAIHSVAIDIYDLVSTTVSGIPMKEETQQGQSAAAINYDVELLHRREAHGELERLGLVIPNSVEDLTGSLMVFSRGATYPTARLVWATPVPKGRWNMFPRNRHASRVTPSQVNSRPSVCLSSYLLQGRNVMLEVMRVSRSENLPNNVGTTKLIAHTLIAHGGHIYIHANDIGPHSILDNQDIREKTKLKRAPNLRIADFVSLIRECTLRIPSDSERQGSVASSDVVCAQPRQHLLRITRYWPLRSDHCYIYNLPKRFDNFFTIIRQSQLSTVDADKCRQVIHQLVTLRDSKDRITGNIHSHTITQGWE